VNHAFHGDGCSATLTVGSRWGLSVGTADIASTDRSRTGWSQEFHAGWLELLKLSVANCRLVAICFAAWIAYQQRAIFGMSVTSVAVSGAEARDDLRIMRPATGICEIGMYHKHIYFYSPKWSLSHGLLVGYKSLRNVQSRIYFLTFWFGLEIQLKFWHTEFGENRVSSAERT
jgi:hypothetical protein